MLEGPGKSEGERISHDDFHSDHDSHVLHFPHNQGVSKNHQGGQGLMVEKERVNITFTQPYLDFMNRLVKSGLYFNRGAVMMEALRVLAEKHGVPIVNKEAGL